jgi:membrane-bound lytic murein transglycosylase D
MRYLYLQIICVFLLLIPGCLPGQQQTTARIIPAEQISIPAIEGAVEEITVPEPNATVAEEVQELARLGEWEEGHEIIEPTKPEITYDFPVTINKQVEFYLDFFQNRQPGTFRKWLERSGRYVPHIQAELKKAGLPLDLAYLPMIESGYSLTAYSRARAAGPWQFIRSTGRHYGLTVNAYVDERRDPVRSTEAAIAFLSDLYADFDDWALAVAAYNAGGGKIRKGLRRYKVDNFWDLASHRYLKNETKRYVPKLIAAIIIAKDPEAYGFTNLKYHAPLEYEIAMVPRWTSLRSVTVASNIDYDTLHNLNRQLRKRITPPDTAHYPLKVPIGKKDLIAKNLHRVYPLISTEYKTHIVKGSDTLSGVCRKYNIKKLTLLKTNNLKTARLTEGQRLRIPYQTTKYVLWNKDGSPPLAAADTNLILHKIRPGETVSVISKKYGVPMHMIAIWNDLENMAKIRAGQQLAIYLEEGRISRKHTVASAKPVIQTGITSTEQTASGGKVTYYHVKSGDTLWTISRQFNLSMDTIKRWNSLKSDVIHPGTKLLVKTAAL